jgi:hypothetical protein
LTKKEKYGIMLTMRTIMDEYDAGYSDAENDLQIKLDKMIADQKTIYERHEHKDEWSALMKLQDVRKELFGSYA